MSAQRTTRDLGESDSQGTELRVRTLTEKADGVYQKTASDYKMNLGKLWIEIRNMTDNITSLDREEKVLFEYRQELINKYNSYAQLSDEFHKFLTSTRTSESLKERELNTQLRTSSDQIIESKLELLKTLINDVIETQSIKSRRASSQRSAGTEASSRASIADVKRAQVEAEKARLQYSLQEAELKKRKAALEADLEVLGAKKNLAAAEAEAKVLGPGTDPQEKLEPGFIESIPKEEANARTVKYVTSLDPTASPFFPYQLENEKESLSMAKEFSKVILKKDLLLTSFIKFNDEPQSYHNWKRSFHLKLQELEVTPLEEVDLLLKWTGPESSKQVLSLKNSNMSDPKRCLTRIWERLDERYGSPEMVEASLKRKLDNFPKLTNLQRDCKKLYELSDIVSEIESVKEDPRHGTLLAYFDSSSGVSPIVNKLPNGLQEKWITTATKYMDINGVPYPPFSHFAHFLREQSRIRNNPSFTFSIPAKQQVENSPVGRRNDNIRQISTRKTDVVSDQVNTPRGAEEILCPLHNTKHSLNKCRKFRAKPVAYRRKFMVEKNLCFRCCSPGHRRQDCTNATPCDECGSDRHPTALHFDFKQGRADNEVANHGGEPAASSSSKVEEKTVINSKCAQICGTTFEGKSCAKIVLVNLFPKGNPENSVKVYALIDDQSNRSLAHPDFFNSFDGEFPEVQYSLASCSGVVNTSGRRAKGFVVQSLDGETELDLPVLTECCQIPNIRNEIATPEAAMAHPHLRDISPYIPEIDEDAPIMLLIGRDLTEAHHVLDQRIGPRGSPYAQRLSLGWVIVGETCLGQIHRPQADVVMTFKTQILSNGRPSVFQPCSNEFILRVRTPRDKICTQDGIHDRLCSKSDDHLGRDVFVRTKEDERVGTSVEDRAFIDMMDKEFERDLDGHWVAPLPFRSQRPRLPNNRGQAFKRAQVLHANLQRNPIKREHMFTFMKDILEKKHAERAPALKEGEEVWYLPLFGVYHPKKPDKIRGVFDSSAVFEGLSLNKVLMKGPDLTNSLLGVLLRFRQEPVAVTADIEHMFYCFSVREDHRNFLRFLWYEDNEFTKPLIEYRMCKHVFGNSPSPSVASYGLKRTAKDNETEFGSDVKEFIDNNFYVDDGLTSKGSAEEAISLMSRTQEALGTADIRLHKIASNSQDVIDAFPKEDLAKNLKDLDIWTDTLPLQNSLGLCWDLQQDAFSFKVSDSVKPYTRRGILSTINSLYDPLGFLAPVTIKGKVLLRDMVAGTKDWDEPISEEFRNYWEEWEGNLSGLDTLKIRRTYHDFGNPGVTSQEIYMYCDASETAIAAAAYMKSINEHHRVNFGFIMGKSKVAPKQGHTIPRLELCAAVLAVEIAELVSDELSMPIETVKYFTDSKVVLGYLNNETRRFYVYVANRVARILRSSKPNQWSYVPTEQNPADSGTRYVNAAQLGDSMWLLGPQEKSVNNIEPLDNHFEIVDPDTDKELRPEIGVYKCQVDGAKNVLGMDRAKRFSSMNSLVRAVAYLQHVAAGFKLDKGDSCYGWHKCTLFKTVGAIRDAEKVILKEAQHQYYAEEVDCLRKGRPLPRKSTVLGLSPILDKEGIMRVGGRLTNAKISVLEKNPILIPGKHHVALLLIRRCHENVHHQGRHITEGAVRGSGYWITGGKRLISSVIHDCVVCRKLRGKFAFQKMADLPPDRLQPGPPFTSVGVDCFGPWQVVSRRTRGGQANSKRWAVLFTCLVSRAVHIEVIEEMSSSSFINALRRFIALRGKVKIFRSDQGTNFVGSTEQLGINVQRGDVSKFLLDNGATWIFNPPHSSHMGGVWERMIGVTRRILDALLISVAAGSLTHEVLTTFLAEATAIINSRPLVPLSSDPQNPYPLSPSLIITQKSDNIEVAVPTDIKDLCRAQYKRVQILADIFWKRWRKEFLQTLQPRHKWTENGRNMNVGDIVLLRDEQLHRNSWPTGIITKVIPSSDGKVRTIEVRVASHDGKITHYTRPICELVLLVAKDCV